MPIRPVDLQVMIPKVVDISRIQADEQQHNLAMLQNKAQSVAKQSEESLRQVNAKERTHKALIKNDNKKKGKEQRQQNRQGQPEGKEAEKQSRVYNKTISDSTIDIRL